ncbi:MAG: GNAT family N-acetyltransferase [Armatimonadaceae bacterium]
MTPGTAPTARSGELTVRRLTEDDRPALYDLRLRILRPGRPPEAAIFAGDDLPTTIHIGAFLANGQCVGIATLVENNGLQLRGMAVDDTVQGQGVGAAILREAYRAAAEAGHDAIWCNARTSAAGFYEKQGWVRISDEFSIPDVGPHYKMTKSLVASA